MTPPVLLDNDLFKEKSLWQLYRLTWRGRFPWRLCVPAILAALSLGGYAWLVWPSAIEMVALARVLANCGFSYAATMLGFIVAGFTIFATVMKPELMARLNKVRHQKTTTSSLKWTFVVFMHIFIHYVAFVMVSGAVIAFGGEGGLMHELLKLLSFGVRLKQVIAVVSLVGLGAWFFHLIALAGSFVWNIYQVCALVVTVETEKLL